MGQMTYYSLAILACAAIDDVRTRKIHNWLLGVLFFISLGLVLYFQGVAGLPMAFFGLLTGFLIYLPMAWVGIIGGGDLKLLALSGLTLGSHAVILVGFFSLLWGSVMGLLLVLFRGEAKTVFKNIFALLRLQKIEPAQIHTIPFGAAIFLGALTESTWSRL